MYLVFCSHASTLLKMTNIGSDTIFDSSCNAILTYSFIYNVSIDLCMFLLISQVVQITNEKVQSNSP